MHAVADRIWEILGVMMRCRTQNSGEDKAIVSINRSMLLESIMRFVVLYGPVRCVTRQIGQRTVNEGWNSIVGSDFDQIIHAVQQAKKARPIIEYGDGNASENIVKILLNQILINRGN